VGEPIEFINYQGKAILVVDFSNRSTQEVEKIVRAVPEHVATKPLGSVLLLADFTGASFDQEVLRAMQQTAVFNKPYIKKSAWVGAEGFPAAFRDSLTSFARRDFPTFRTRKEALNWLVADN